MPNQILSMAGMAEAPCLLYITLIWMSLIGSFLLALSALATRGRITLFLSMLT